MSLPHPQTNEPEESARPLCVKCTGASMQLSHVRAALQAWQQACMHMLFHAFDVSLASLVRWSQQLPRQRVDSGICRHDTHHAGTYAL